jgi:hypothetical protein
MKINCNSQLKLLSWAFERLGKPEIIENWSEKFRTATKEGEGGREGGRELEREGRESNI